MRNQQNSPVQNIDSRSTSANVDHTGKPHSEIQLSPAQQLTPYEVIRRNNCKTFNFVKSESYPNIRPAVSKCDDAQTVDWLYNEAEDFGCGRYFDMEQDDVIEVWNKSLDKQNLSYYGVSSGQPEKEALQFQKALARAMRKATSVKKPTMNPGRLKPANLTLPREDCRPFVLNRELLQEKIKGMPTVQRKINASEAFSVLHCPLPIHAQYPFASSEPRISLATALDMDRPVTKQKYGLRRRYKYCDLKCGIPQNVCTDYEWTKYKQDPKAIEKAFEIEMQQREAQQIPEPKDYDELFEHLITCFENYSKKDSLCELYNTCCKPKSDKTGDEGGSPRGPSGQPGGDQIEFPPIKDDSMDLDKPEKEKKGGTSSADEKSSRDKNLFNKEKEETEHGKETFGKSEGDIENKKNVKKHSKKPVKDGKEGQSSETDAGKKWKKGDKNEDKNTGKNNKLEKAKNTGKKGKSSEDDHGIPQPILDNKVSTISVTSVKGKTKKKKKVIDQENKRQQRKSKTPKSKPPVVDHCKKPMKDCPCEICKFMKRRQTEPDTPFISQLKREEKRRQLREYYRMRCHREQLKCRRPEYPAPQHKCDPIVCDDFFCKNPRISKYCDCLKAMQELQKQLGPKHRNMKNELIFNLRDLRSRLCKRLCDCLS
ncbi:PREDICTED: uncharacterized protein LOC108610107 [Drosophila arizonae]|uniref:Uncharacterized protein LOC108610107 n=1 Tax=Drosophila arizonae TaxID=7263 RepID=A0ABM1NR58_DROAR|nr:PREDICTED: uncharacterized protein LOC108610107 [Drosophila arizonae]